MKMCIFHCACYLFFKHLTIDLSINKRGLQNVKKTFALPNHSNIEAYYTQEETEAMLAEYIALEQDDSLISRAKAKDLKDKVILQYLDLIHKMVGKFPKAGQPSYTYEDYFMVGIEGVIEAISTYDPSRSKFITHAHNVIRYALLHFRCEAYTPLKVSRSKSVEFFKARKIKDLWEVENGQEIDLNTWSAISGLTTDDLVSLTFASYEIYSIYATVNGAEEESTLEGMLSYESQRIKNESSHSFYSDPESIFLEKEEQEERRGLLKNLFQRLTTEELNVLKLRNLIINEDEDDELIDLIHQSSVSYKKAISCNKNGFTMKETAKILNLTEHQARHLEEKAKDMIDAYTMFQNGEYRCVM